MVLSLPTGVKTYQSGRWRFISNKQRFTSPISRVGQRVARPGSFWAATLTVPPISDPGLAATWAAFLAKLSEGESFYLYPPLIDLHTVTGTPRVKGAGQAGQTLLLDGFNPGDTLRAGGFVCYDTSTFRMLHIVAETMVADGAGEIALPVRPMIRKSPPDNALVTVSYPTCEMILENSDVDLLTLTEAVQYGQTVNVIEDVRE